MRRSRVKFVIQTTSREVQNSDISADMPNLATDPTSGHTLSTPSTPPQKKKELLILPEAIKTRMCGSRACVVVAVAQ